MDGCSPWSGEPAPVQALVADVYVAFAAELRNLARRTRVRQSDYLREAVADLLAKYGQLPDGRSTM